ncbi:MAG: mechanosensitive ion channel [Magnetococcales bacterium]|nr:mechanosensitive ion channel [Magnetococcales bacterium]
MTKRRQVILIIAVIFILGGVTSYVAKKYFLAVKDVIPIALVAPITGINSVTGQSMLRGAELAVSQFNEILGDRGKELELTIFDDASDETQARAIANEIAQNGDYVTVIGHATASGAKSASFIYEDNQIPFITFAAGGREIVDGKEWVFKIGINGWQQARFLANYTKNVLKQNIATIVHENSLLGKEMARGFEETYKRFGTRVRFKWSYNGEEDRRKIFTEVIETLKEKRDTGIIFLAMPANDAANFVTYARGAKLKNRFVGPDSLASHDFSQKIKELSGEMAANDSNNILLTSSLLWDTADQQGQQYNNAYQKRYRGQSDWIGANAYDAVSIAMKPLMQDRLNLEIKADQDTGFFESLRLFLDDEPQYIEEVEAPIVIEDEDEDSLSEVEKSRRKIHKYLRSLTSLEKSYQGVNGKMYFDEFGEVQKNILLGKYNGTQLISDLTQLMPITAKGNINFINEIKQGRMLYVNDRFMYKTNVVYSGVNLKEASNINLEENTVDLEFSIWFRYQGAFNPADLQLINAVGDVSLGEPIEESIKKDLNFKLYKVKGTFRLNFSNALRPYGSQVLGLSFRHKNLSRNNIILVVDVLGIRLGSGVPLSETIQKSKIIDPTLGWVVDQAWYSSETTVESSMGRPQFVGFGTEEPSFSRMDFGVMISSDSFSIRDIVPSEYFIYLGIFAVIGIFFGVGIDARNRTLFFSIVSFGLYAFSWPLFLLASGNILLDFAVNNLTISAIDSIVRVYDIIWWFMPPVLINVAVERFIWKPLERRTEQIVPNIIRKFVSVIFYLFAFLGVIAFVFGQALTSLLATGGLLTMIIGLAVQSNIANIFSGIVVNIERPFSVGDWIKIGLLDDAQVIDITWRTLRLKTLSGVIISVPNGMASDAAVLNYTVGGATKVKIPVYVSTKHDPLDIIAHLEEVCANVPQSSEVKPIMCVNKGVENFFRQWVAVYEIWYWLEDYTDGSITRALWVEIFRYFAEQDISIDVGSREDVLGENKEVEEGFKEAREEDWDQNMLEEMVD